MPFSGTTYTNVSGATTAAAGQTVQSTVWNNIHTDYATALTMLNSQYASVNTERNILCMNGGFEVWQRGAGSSASISVSAANTPGAYTADRWYMLTNANQACTASATTGLSSQSNLAGKYLRNNGQTGTGTLVVGYPLDTDEIIRMRGKTVYINFLVKTGANWSAASVTAVLYLGTGSVAKRGGGYTSETQAFSITTALGTSSAATQVSGSSSAIIPTTTTQAELQFQWTPTGTAGVDDSISFDDVSIEVATSSSTWTPMNYDRLPFPTMLSLCKRHYQKTFNYSVAPAQSGGLPGALGLAVLGPNIPTLYWEYPVEVRATGAVTTYSPSGATANWVDNTVSASIAVTQDSAAIGQKGVLLYGTTATGTATVAQLIYIHAQVDAGI